MSGGIIVSNICPFNMEIIGDKNQVEAFLKSLEDCNHRINDYSITDTESFAEDIIKVSLNGSCDWSIQASMLSEKPEFLNLTQASKKYPLAIEVFSDEDGNCFQEHFHAVCGELISNECADYHILYTKDRTRAELVNFFALYPDYGVTIENYEDYLEDDGKLYLGGLENYGCFHTEQNLKDYLQHSLRKYNDIDKKINQAAYLKTLNISNHGENALISAAEKGEEKKDEIR